MKARVLILVPVFACIAPAAVRAEGDVPEKYRETVRKGLDYLVKQQHQDGRWEGDEGKYPVATTALAGMALLMEGSSIYKGQYRAHLRKAAVWLMNSSEPKRDGLIFSGHASESGRYIEGHALATQFLAWAYKQDPPAGRGGEEELKWQKRIDDVIARAVRYSLRARSSRGGWYHTSSAEGHDFDAILPTALQLHALRMVAMSWVELLGKSEAISAGDAYLQQELPRKAKENPDAKTCVDVAAALSCAMYGFRSEWNEEPQQTWFPYCAQHILPGRHGLAHYYFAHAMYMARAAKDWTGYRNALCDRLQAAQKGDGSWPSSDGLSVGPVYAAALWCTVLQLDRGSHPMVVRGL